MSDGDAISEQEKMKIVKDFISQAPPGQFSNVFTDTRILLDNDALLKTGTKSFMGYHIDQMTPVTVDGEKVLLSNPGASGEGFLAPNSAKLFTFDPLKQEATLTGNSAEASPHEDFRSAMDESVKKYISDHYQKGINTVYATKASDGLELTVLIESHEYQTGNYYAGNWRSVWSVKVDTNKKSAELKGTVKVQVHYYEDGNVQLLTSKTMTDSVSYSDPTSLATHAAASISKLEAKFQAAISAAYNKFNTDTFKSLRRALPVIHSKLNWEQMAAYKIGAELKSQ